MTEGLRRPIEMVAQKDHGGDVLHPLADLLGALPEQGAGDVAAARYREFEIFEHREVFVDRRSLEFSSDAETYDLLFLAAGDFLVLELDRALRDLRPTADQVEHRGLAGAVRPDDDAQLALVDVEVESVDGLEPIEGDADVLEREQKIGAAGHDRCLRTSFRGRWTGLAPTPPSPASQPRNKLIGYETCEPAREREHHGNEQPAHGEQPQFREGLGE